jgi:hypothetical protein
MKLEREVLQCKIGITMINSAVNPPQSQPRIASFLNILVSRGESTWFKRARRAKPPGWVAHGHRSELREGVVSQTFASWNHTAAWLRAVDSLRHAA